MAFTGPEIEAAKWVINFFNERDRGSIDKQDVIAAIRKMENAGWIREELPDLMRAYHAFDEKPKVALGYIYNSTLKRLSSVVSEATLRNFVKLVLEQLEFDPPTAMTISDLRKKEGKQIGIEPGETQDTYEIINLSQDSGTIGWTISMSDTLDEYVAKNMMEEIQFSSVSLNSLLDDVEERYEETPEQFLQ